MNRHLANAPATLIAFVLLVLCASLAIAQNGDDFDLAVADFRAGNFACAATLFARVENTSPGKTDALLYQAKSLVHLQDFSGAERALRLYNAAHTDSSDALYLLGFVLNRLNRPADSLNEYTRAAALAPPAADDLKIVGLDYVLLDDYDDAIRWLDKAVERDPRNADAWYYLGRAYYTKARLGDARKAFETVLALDPRSTKAETNLGLILETEGQPTAAIKAYRTAIAWQEQGSSSPRKPSELMNGQLDDRQNERLNEQPYANLGNLLMEQGQTKEAIPLLEKAIALAPSNAFCHMTLGIAYRQADQLENARSELEKATLLEPENAKAHYQLGRLYKDIHDIDRAKVEFKKTEDLKAKAAGLRAAPAKP
jgi:tetratricopeptide (TPR) repeat protein